MALTIYAGWDHDRVGTATIAWDNGAARTTSITTDTYSHLNLSGIMGTSQYVQWAAALDTAMDATSAGNTVTFSTSGLAYLLTRGAAWTVTVGTNVLMRNILGLPLDDGDYPVASVDLGGGIHAIASTRRPAYLISPALGGKSEVRPDYEPAGIAEDGESGGESYGICLDDDDIPTYHDFKFMFETAEATRIADATSAVPWTYEHLVKHCRNIEPIGILDGVASTLEVFKLLADGASWDVPYHVEDLEALNDIPFRCRLLGRA